MPHDTDECIDWKGKAFVTYARLAMIVPPWNIFWWVVGAATYPFVFGKNDASGDGALAWVIGAPVTIPLYPFILAKDALERRRLDAQERKLVPIAAELDREMAAAGIAVKRIIPMATGIIFDADVPPEREQAYRDVFRRVIRMHPDVSPDLICDRPQPAGPLHRDWAAAVGLSRYGATVTHHPCPVCNEPGFSFDIWVADEEERARFIRDYMETPECYHFKDGTTRLFHGFVCRTCLDGLHGGWTSAHQTKTRCGA